MILTAYFACMCVNTARVSTIVTVKAKRGLECCTVWLLLLASYVHVLFDCFFNKNTNGLALLQHNPALNHQLMKQMASISSYYEHVLLEKNTMFWKACFFLQATTDTSKNIWKTRIQIIHHSFQSTACRNPLKLSIIDGPLFEVRVSHCLLNSWITSSWAWVSCSKKDPGGLSSSMENTYVFISDFELDWSIPKAFGGRKSMMAISSQTCLSPGPSWPADQKPSMKVFSSSWTRQIRLWPWWRWTLSTIPPCWNQYLLRFLLVTYWPLLSVSYPNGHARFKALEREPDIDSFPCAYSWAQIYHLINLLYIPILLKWIEGGSYNSRPRRPWYTWLWQQGQGNCLSRQEGWVSQDMSSR